MSSMFVQYAILWDTVWPYGQGERKAFSVLNDNTDIYIQFTYGLWINNIMKLKIWFVLIY